MSLRIQRRRDLGVPHGERHFLQGEKSITSSYKASCMISPQTREKTGVSSLSARQGVRIGLGKKSPSVRGRE